MRIYGGFKNDMVAIQRNVRSIIDKHFCENIVDEFYSQYLPCAACTDDIYGFLLEDAHNMIHYLYCLSSSKNSRVRAMAHKMIDRIYAHYNSLPNTIVLYDKAVVSGAIEPIYHTISDYTEISQFCELLQRQAKNYLHYVGEDDSILTDIYTLEDGEKIFIECLHKETSVKVCYVLPHELYENPMDTPHTEEEIKDQFGETLETLAHDEESSGNDSCETFPETKIIARANEHMIALLQPAYDAWLITLSGIIPDGVEAQYIHRRYGEAESHLISIIPESACTWDSRRGRADGNPATMPAELVYGTNEFTITFSNNKYYIETVNGFETNVVLRKFENLKEVYEHIFERRFLNLADAKSFAIHFLGGAEDEIRWLTRTDGDEYR